MDGCNKSELFQVLSQDIHVQQDEKIRALGNFR